MMKKVVVNQFGGPEELHLVDEAMPEPGPGEVRVRLTSIGMNHAELMARSGNYKMSSGEPPFTPGLEGGGIIDAIGSGVTERAMGDRVILAPQATRPREPGGSPMGSYRTHFIVAADETFKAPPALPDDQLGTLWLSHLTAWGCLVWKQQINPGDTVAIPAASSSVGLAASQVVRGAGAIPIGLTSSAEKLDQLKSIPAAKFESVILTRDASGNKRPWHRDLLAQTDGRGIDVFFDPVAAGDYLNTEIRSLAMGGTIWVYGLLGQVGPVDVSPLIRKRASIRGWIMGEVADAGTDVLNHACSEIINKFQSGDYVQHVPGSFPLADVQKAHREMEKGDHIGKLVLIPGQ